MPPDECSHSDSKFCTEKVRRFFAMKLLTILPTAHIVTVHFVQRKSIDPVKWVCEVSYLQKVDLYTIDIQSQLNQL